MSAATEFARLHRLTPKEAVDYLKAREKLTVTYSWMDLWQEEHARQFTVSRLTRLDILKAMRDGITASCNGDLSRRDWKRDMTALLKKEGWWGEKEVIDPETGEVLKTTFDSSRLDLIHDTHMRQAYAAGQWQRIEKVKKTHPYVRYITRRDDKVRAAHAAWDTITLPVDDPFWDTHMPPCDLRCRCRVTTMRAEDYEARKEAGSIVTERPTERMVEFVNKRTGKVTRAPYGVNPGFAYNPGKAAMRNAEAARLAAEKISDAPPELAALTLGEIAQGLQALPPLAKAMLVAGIESKAFTDWYDNPPRGTLWPMARIPDADAVAMGAKDGVRIARMSDETALKQKRPDKHGELSARDYAEAQRVVDEAQHKIMEKPNSLIYVWESPDKERGGYVLAVKATKVGDELYILSYRRLSRTQAQRDEDIGRLWKKEGRK